MSKITFDLTMKNSNEAYLKLAGIIDEDMDFTAIGIGDAKSLEIDMEHVRSINSCGIREWISWISNLKNTSIYLFKCPKIIVDQMNMVQGFLPPQARVMSFFVPFFNDDSGSEKNILFEYGQQYTEGALNIPSDVQDDEGNTMEIDVVESKYFKFLKVS
jgi:hypothetical protein